MFDISVGWERGWGGGVGQYPGPIVSDVVSVKTLSTRIEAGLDELKSAELVSMMRQGRCPPSWSDGTPESRKYADRKSPILPPSAVVIVMGSYCDITFC